MSGRGVEGKGRGVEGKGRGVEGKGRGVEGKGRAGEGGRGGEGTCLKSCLKIIIHCVSCFIIFQML